MTLWIKAESNLQLHNPSPFWALSHQEVMLFLIAMTTQHLPHTGRAWKAMSHEPLMKNPVKGGCLSHFCHIFLATVRWQHFLPPSIVQFFFPKVISVSQLLHKTSPQTQILIQLHCRSHSARTQHKLPSDRPPTNHLQPWRETHHRVKWDEQI